MTARMVHGLSWLGPEQTGFDSRAERCRANETPVQSGADGCRHRDVVRGRRAYCECGDRADERFYVGNTSHVAFTTPVSSDLHLRGTADCNSDSVGRKAKASHVLPVRRKSREPASRRGLFGGVPQLDRTACREESPRNSRGDAPRRLPRTWRSHRTHGPQQLGDLDHRGTRRIWCATPPHESTAA